MVFNYLRSRSNSGFISVEPAMFIAWLFLYGLTGSLIGKTLGHPTAGIITGVLIGFYPSLQLGIAGHYGTLLSLLPIPVLIINLILGKTFPKPILIILTVTCILPFILLIYSLIKSWSVKKEK